MTQKKPAPPSQPEPRVKDELGEIRNTSKAADLCRRILRAQARTRARKAAAAAAEEQRDDAA